MLVDRRAPFIDQCDRTVLDDVMPLLDRAWIAGAPGFTQFVFVLCEFPASKLPSAMRGNESRGGNYRTAALFWRGEAS